MIPRIVESEEYENVMDQIFKCHGYIFINSCLFIGNQFIYVVVFFDALFEQ